MNKRLVFLKKGPKVMGCPAGRTCAVLGGDVHVRPGRQGPGGKTPSRLLFELLAGSDPHSIGVGRAGGVCVCGNRWIRS